MSWEQRTNGEWVWVGGGVQGGMLAPPPAPFAHRLVELTPQEILKALASLTSRVCTLEDEIAALRKKP